MTSLTALYGYDATGNRTAKSIGGATYTNTVSSTSNDSVRESRLRGLVRRG